MEREDQRKDSMTEEAKRPGPDRVGAQAEVQSWCGQCLELFPGAACVVVCWEGWVYLHHRASQDEDKLSDIPLGFLVDVTSVPYTLENEYHSRDKM